MTTPKLQTLYVYNAFIVPLSAPLFVHLSVLRLYF